jgi:hypothetical protein
LAIDITAAGLPGNHTFARVNVNSQDDYIYFKNSDIPEGITNGSSYIYADEIGQISGVGSGSLVYAQIESDQVLKLLDDQQEPVDITDSTNGFVSFNSPVLYDNKLNINMSTPSNQAVKYYTTGAPLSNLISGNTYFLKNVPAEFSGTQSLYEISGNTHTFTSCGRSGRRGPNAQEILNGYSTSWHGTYLRRGLFDGYQEWTVPVSGIYQFNVAGASGFEGSGTGTAGRGAIVRGQVALTKGEVVVIAVGQTGEAPDSGSLYGGSGGGTFVVRKQGNEPLFIAGGGSADANAVSGQDGQTTNRGGSGALNRPGGENGFGGLALDGRSAGGGGFFGRGENTSVGERGGGSFIDGLEQVDNGIRIGGNGGFGGGGSSDGNNSGQSGGAGGYSGGAGSRTNFGNARGGGGGSFISRGAINVATSNGQYEDLGSFNDQPIANLNSYNTGNGSVTVSLIESFTSGNTVHPTAQDAENGTNAIAIQPAGNSYHAFVPISYDLQNERIHFSSPHGFENGEAISFSLSTPSPDIDTSVVYYVNKIDNFTIGLVYSPAVNFTVPTPRSTTDVIRKIVVNLDLDSLNIPNHGFSADQPIQYSSGGGTPIAPLQDGATYYVAEVVDPNNFKLKVALDAPAPINFTQAGTGTSHSFIFLTVNFVENTLYIPSHGLVSGQAVRYTTNSGTVIGGLVNDQTYYVIRVDGSTIRLSSTPNLQNIVNLTSVGVGTHSIVVVSINFANNTITIPNHGFLQGELVEYDSRGQTVINGLETNQTYYVIFVDGNNIRLASTPQNADANIAINLIESPAGVGRHTLTSLSQTPDGIYSITSVPSDDTFTVAARGQVPDLTKVFNPRSTVDIELDTLFFASHGFTTGTKVRYNVGEAGTAIGGLSNNTDYYAVVVNQDYFRLATSLENALAGIKIDLTNFGSGVLHSLVTNQLNGSIVGSGNVSVAAGSVLVDGVGTSFSKILKVGDPFTLYPPNITETLIFGNTNVNTGNNRIEIAHNFEPGEYVKFNTGGGVAPTPLINNYYYYVGVVDANAIQLFTSKAAALALTSPISFSSSGTGTNFSLTNTIPVGPIVRRITAVGSDTQVTVDRPYSSEYSLVSYAYPTFVYVRPSGYSLHRPFDGGVEMSTGAGNSFGQIIRQTRKYFRYQSGKGIQTSFAINFKPSIDLESMSRFSPTTIECKTRRPHGLISGLFVQISEAENSQGQPSTLYNGNFQVTVVDLTTFRITAATTVPTGPESRAYGFPQFHVTSWTNGAIRSGMFDFQNGMFFEFDGQKLYAVRRSSTQQTAGTVSALRGSELIFGEGTKFTAQFDEGDFIVMRGQTYKIIDIKDDTTLSVRPEYRGSTGLEFTFDPETQVELSENKFNITRHGLSQNLPVVYNSIDGESLGGLINGRTYYADVINANSFRLLATPDAEVNVNISSLGTTNIHSFIPAKSGIIVTKTVDVKVPQDQWNIDKCDGNGPSGYNLDLSRIQMCYIDYSWYGAGKIRFGFKTNDGLVRYVHEFKHNNVLFESYLRSGNLPARYEVVTFENPTYIPSLFHWGTSVIMDGTFDDDRGYLFTSGSQTLDIRGTTTKSFAGQGIDLETDLITSLTHGFRTTDVIQFQSIAADGFPGTDTQNPATEIVGSNTTPFLINNSKYGVLVNSPDRIHLTPENAKFNFGATLSRTGTTVTVVTPSAHNIPNGAYVGVYGLTDSNFANGTFTANVSNGTTFTYTVPGGPGSLVNITNTVLTSNVATITTSGAHGFVTNQSVTIDGATNTIYNGTYVITSTPTSNTFTFARVNANIGSASSAGTVALSVASTLQSGSVIAEVINFTSRGNIQYTYFLYPEGSLNNTSGPNYQPLISLRLSPSADSGLTGKLGDRDIINRMQVRMQEIGVSTDELVEVKLILNGRLNNLGFTPVDPPSLVEIVEHTPQDTISGGIQIYNFQAEAKSTTNLDLDSLFELSNSILGGDNIFPDGPDILTVAVSRLTGENTRTSAKLSWQEAQA